MNQTYTLPQNLGDILGAHHDGNLQTQVSEIKAGIGVLNAGTILATGTAGDIGKLVKLTAGTEAQLVWHSAGSLNRHCRWHLAMAASPARLQRRAVSRVRHCIVPAGMDAGLIAVALRGRGIFVEGPIPVPAAAAAAALEREAPAEIAEGGRETKR